jgi:hypothetical protein
MSVFASASFVIPLLRSLAGDAVRKKMEKADSKILAGMASKGMTPEEKPLRDCVRDAIFRLWRSVIPSGDIADAVRDYQDDRVMPEILDVLGSSPTLAEVVSVTRTAILEHARELAGG